MRIMRVHRKRRMATGLGLAFVALMLVLVAACGETRRPIGDECLRNEDCLSSVCAARACVAAPPLVTGASNPPPDEEPRIPGDAAASSTTDGAPSDAKTEGG